MTHSCVSNLFHRTGLYQRIIRIGIQCIDSICVFLFGTDDENRYIGAGADFFDAIDAIYAGQHQEKAAYEDDGYEDKENDLCRCYVMPFLLLFRQNRFSYLYSYEKRVSKSIFA